MSSLKNFADNIAQGLADNLNFNVMMDHIDNVERGIREIDDDYFKALEIRAHKYPDGKFIKPSSLIIRAITYAQIYHVGQKRKGKQIPYIIHPLMVGEILASVTNDEKVIAAGILHDTVEDTHASLQDIEQNFGKEVAEMVNDVTEQDKSLSWVERKRIALEHIPHMSHGSLLVKSADVLHNMADLLTDFEKEGEEIFNKFNAPKEKQLERYNKLVLAIEKAWPENPLLPDLKKALSKIQTLWE